MISLPGLITVLIVDDSAVVRRAMRAAFEQDRRFCVVGEAATGEQAVALASSLGPRLVTMDLAMPGGGGLEAIEKIMAYTPTRIVVVTAEPRLGGKDMSFEALARGALDLVEKSAEPARLLEVASRIASVPVLPHVDALRKERRERRLPATSLQGVFSARQLSVVGIGASTGGPRTLRAILGSLPAGFPLPMVVVQHLEPLFGPGFIAWLDAQTDLRVAEALPGSRLEPGTVLVGVRGAHVGVSSRGVIEPIAEPPRGGHCPAIDVLFESLGRSYGSTALGVLLTGMGSDGARGLEAIHKAGGLTVAQDEASCAVFGMPRAAIDLGAAEHILSVGGIGRALLQAAGYMGIRDEPTGEGDP